MKKHIDENESFISITPKNELLKSHISYYYFHESYDSNFSKKIIYHPHFVTGINSYKNVKIIKTDNGREYVPINSNKITHTVTVNKHQSKIVQMNGVFMKIGIVFNSLGINNFINVPLSELVDDTLSFFNYFGEEFNVVVKKVFETNIIEEKQMLLDDFFLLKHIEFKEEKLINAVELILQCNDKIRVSDIANSVNTSRATLLRLFKKHLCFSVEEFINVVRFRKVLHDYLNYESKPKLTQIAIDAHYYDQSDFIKRINKITSVNPKLFFKNVRKIENSQIYWTINKN
jgi:AraC-like DNA-binding protein